MPATAAADYEVSVLARVLGNDQEELPADMARYLLGIGFSPRDKDRRHDLAVRNQGDTLSADEKEELFAYARTGSVLSILKSKARRVLKIKPKRRVLLIPGVRSTSSEGLPQIHTFGGEPQR